MNLPDKIDSYYKNIKTINLSDLGIRKKINIFIAQNLDKEYTIIVYITQKSRFLQKDVEKIEEIKTIILKNTKNNITRQVIVIDSPLCSKAKTKLKESNWDIFT